MSEPFLGGEEGAKIARFEFDRLKTLNAIVYKRESKRLEAMVRRLYKARTKEEIKRETAFRKAQKRILA